MDIKLREILNKVYNQEMQPDEAQWKIFVLFNVSGSVFDDKIDEWHNSDTPLSLSEYLGLTEEQFKIWLKTPEEIEKH